MVNDTRLDASIHVYMLILSSTRAHEYMLDDRGGRSMAAWLGPVHCLVARGVRSRRWAGHAGSQSGPDRARPLRSGVELGYGILTMNLTYLRHDFAG